MTSSMIYSYQLALYFIKEFKYKLVDVKGLNNEIWVFSKDHRIYPVIRIAICDPQELEANIRRSNNVHHSIMNSLNLHENMLTIYISDKTCDRPNCVCIKPDHYSGLELKDFYPMIHNIVHDVSNIEIEYARLIGEFKQYSNMKPTWKEIVRKYPFVTDGVMIVCILNFLLSLYLKQYLSSSSEIAILLGAYYKAYICMGQWYRLLTCGFVHVEWLHLLCNMISLYSLGIMLEKYYGHLKFLIIFFFSIIMGSLFMFATRGNTVCLGLSGGLYGLIGALTAYIIQTKIYRIPAVRTSIISTVVINICLNFMPGIGVMAHLGGFFCGLALAFMFSARKDWDGLRKNIIIAFAVLLIALGYKCYNNRKLDTIYFGTDMNIINTLDSLGFHDASDSLFKDCIKYYGEMK